MQTTRLIIVAVGGQGNLLSSKVLAEAALIEDMPVRLSEIHGMAQRGGVVESSLVFGDADSTIISDGQADILLGFEPGETLRAINRCSENTIVITNTHPLPPFTAAIGKGVYPDIDEVCRIIEANTAKLYAFNAMELARRAGNPMTMNIVLLGALLKSGTIPFSRQSLEEAVRRKTKPAFTDMNLAAFDLGFSALETEDAV